MFKYTAHYKNLFTNEPMSEDLYFHLLAPELAELEVSTSEGFAEHSRKVLQSNDGRKILGLFTHLVKLAYGRRTEDGTQFVKRASWTEEFLSSPAWEDLFIWLTQDVAGNNSNKFWLGIMPQRLVEEVETKGDIKLSDMSPDEIVALAKKIQDDTSNTK